MSEQVATSWVAGAWVSAQGAPVERRNPADTDDIAAVHVPASPEQIERAIDAAGSAQPAWARTPAPKRGEILRRAADIARSRADEIAAALTREEGKTLVEARGEVLGGADILEFVGSGGSWAFAGRTAESARPGVLTYTRKHPLGVVGLVTPWNFPFSNPCIKLASALVAGNAAAWKPAPFTVRTAIALTSCLIEAGLPDGVLSTLLGSGATVGARVVDDQRVAAVSFTGSTAVGSQIGVTLAERGGRAQLEMGGKNAVVVLDDADIEAAARATALAAFLSAGQKCTAASRAIVLPSIRGAFLDALLAETAALVVGDPTDPATQVGPVVDGQALAKHVQAVRDAVAAGAKVVAGGDRLGAELETGYYMAPTIVDGVDPGSDLAQREVFGPVLAVLDAADADDALRLANDTRYGLTAAVFTRDLTTAMAFADGLDVGVVKVNEQPPGIEPHVPTGGWKDSGAGPRELGDTTLEFFSEEKTVYLNTGG